ncbi:MAG: hypothetical protein CVU56_19715 [Deltaproteobacteria bacterium HGW-Deltaproteobacteria-14]|nr:MAG: hypothetical protein CVU56_19715 [Deltaproteobacteria bacterium HGW-Deltaproteobacteria-14]
MQLGLLAFGLVILLSFRSDIAEGAAGCFSSLAEGEGAEPPRPPVTLAPTPPSPPVEATPSPAVTPVEVRVIRASHGPDAADSARDASPSSPDAARPAPDAAASAPAGSAAAEDVASSPDAAP